MLIYIPVSIAELLDKITILEIKQLYIENPAKLLHINQELLLLNTIKDQHLPTIDEPLQLLIYELKSTNQTLWNIEELKRKHEKLKLFNQNFIDLARQVYLKNDLRASIKQKINTLTHSTIIETKSHC